MQAHADQVETRLQASMTEIDGLRQNLQTAWSEARTDGLTGLANRRHFDQALRTAAAQAIEHGTPACVVLADIDHFKQFNDIHGHAFGDQVLKLVAGLLRHNVKGRDLVARYGGEEFAVILPATRLNDAFGLADRLRELVSCRQIKLKDRAQSLGRVTLSIGVSEFRPGESCSAWVASADAALYQASSTVAIVSSPSTRPMGDRLETAGPPRRMPQRHEPMPPSGHLRLAACRSQSVQASAGSGGSSPATAPRHSPGRVTAAVGLGSDFLLRPAAIGDHDRA